MTGKVLSYRRGVTLIELITAMAILSLVTLMVFSFLSYGNLAFSQGRSQNAAQSSLRHVNDYIVQEVRFATAVGLLGGPPNPIPDTDENDYIFFNATGNLVHSAYNNDNARIVRQWGEQLQNASHFWSKLNVGKQTIGIELHGVENAQNFDLQSAIELPNIGLPLSGPFIIPDIPSARAIVYQKNYSVTSTSPPLPPGETFAIAVSASHEGRGTVSGGGTYPIGAWVEVSATATAGNYFVRWSEGGVEQSTLPDYSFNVDRTRNLVAEFEQSIPPNLVTVTITIKSKNGEQYRVSLGALTPKVTTMNQTPYTVKFDSVIGGTNFAPLNYSLVVERKKGSDWEVVDNDVLEVRDIDLGHEVAL